MKVLFVCTGNICRSPTALAVFRRRLAEHVRQRAMPALAGIEADSAGTHDYHVGNPPDPRACRTAAARGYDLSTLRARQVTSADFHRFDLILAMDHGHLAMLRRMAPDEVRPRLRLFLDYAPHLGVADLPDPYYGGAAEFEHCLDLVEAAVDGLLATLRADSRPGTSAGCDRGPG